MRIWVDSVGIIGPGLAGWIDSRPMLGGVTPYPGGDLVLPGLSLLPPVERRRTGTMVKLALAAGQDAIARWEGPQADLPTVFVASGGDGDVINEICSTLAGSDRQISPTRFHNSVHNAAAGYWSIATGSRAPSTSLCAFDWSFPAGLVEAAAQIACERDHVLLIASDMPYPQPLAGVRKVKLAFGAALLLARDRSDHSLGSLDINVTAPVAPTRMRDPMLELLREDNPAARGLPVLEALASQRTDTIGLDYVAGKSLSIQVSPC